MIDDMAKAATPSDIWKAPVTAAEEFDRTMALRMAAVTHTPIPATTSLEAYWAQWDDPAIVEDVDNVPEALLAEHGALVEGTSHLLLPAGTRWIAADTLMNTHMHEDGPGDNRFLQRLYVLLLEHKVLRDHMGPSLPTVLLRADTLDVRRVFCTDSDCRAWCDLEADAKEADETLGPWDAS